MATDSDNDEQLLSEIRNGNNPAFSILVRRYSTKYYHLAYRYVLSREEAEDIVQNAFLKLWEKPQAWNPKKGAQFTTWFYRVVVNLCFDWLKKHKTLSMPENFDIKDETGNQEEALAKNDDKKSLAQQVATLPKRQKTALILCFYEEMNHKQAAQVMKINIKALESLLMRAKTTLKDKMKERSTAS